MNSEARRKSAENHDDEDSDESSVRGTDHDEESESEQSQDEGDDGSEHDEQREVVQSKRGIRPLCEIDPPSDMLSDAEGEEEEQSDSEETVANIPITVFVDEPPFC